ncbi:unnamed protein product [Cercospora beticola]|nr:unnamed protein product [Cercospora beticola]
MAELSGTTSGPGWGNKTSGTENLLSSDNYNDNRNLTEKAKDKLSSDRTDRPDDPVSGTNYGQSDSYGSGNNTSSYGDSSYGGNDNRGLADKAKDKLSSDRSDRPDNPVTGRNFDQDTSSSGYGGNNTSSYGDSSYGGNDNRGLADKAKDKLSSDRSDRPDNPVTGRNFDQDTSSSGYGGNNNSSSNYGSSGNNDNRGIGEKIKDKLSSKRSGQPDDPISGTNYGEDSSRGSSGGGLMDKVKAKIGGSGNNRNDNDSYGSSGNTYGGSDSYGSGNNNDRNY